MYKQGKGIFGSFIIGLAVLLPSLAGADNILGLLANYRQERASGIDYSTGNWSYDANSSHLSVIIDRSTYNQCGPHADFAGTITPTVRGFTFTSDESSTSDNLVTLKDTDPNNPVLGTHLLAADGEWHILIFKEEGSMIALGSCKPDIEDFFIAHEGTIPMYFDAGEGYLLDGFSPSTRYDMQIFHGKNGFGVSIPQLGISRTYNPITDNYYNSSTVDNVYFESNRAVELEYVLSYDKRRDTWSFRLDSNDGSFSYVELSSRP